MPPVQNVPPPFYFLKPPMLMVRNHSRARLCGSFCLQTAGPAFLAIHAYSKNHVMAMFAIWVGTGGLFALSLSILPLFFVCSFCKCHHCQKIVFLFYRLGYSHNYFILRCIPIVILIYCDLAGASSAFDVSCVDFFHILTLKCAPAWSALKLGLKIEISHGAFSHFDTKLTLIERPQVSAQN